MDLIELESQLCLAFTEGQGVFVIEEFLSSVGNLHSQKRSLIFLM